MDNNIHLLIVDDDLIFNQLIQSFLSSHGVNAESVFSVAEARDYLSSHKPDFIILDYMLNDGMGIELMEDIKKIELAAPVMMVTADDDQDTMRECFERGIDDYLLKPLNFELLWLKIQRLYESYQLRRKFVQQAGTVQALLDEKENEEALARYVYEHMVSQGGSPDSFVNFLLKSSSAFNGDTLIVSKAPTGNIFVILMDATGHGLAAAISILPLVSVFNTLVAKGLELSSIVFELNHKLGKTIPDDRFVAASVIEIDQDNKRLNIWNGGMPEVLMMDNKGKLVGSCNSKNMPLGILDDVDFDTSVQSYDVSKGGHLVFCSDGLLEQENQLQETFGMYRLKSILASHQPENFVSAIDADFSIFIGEQTQTDDVSFCHVDINKALSINNQKNIKQKGDPGQSNFQLQLSARQLEKFDVMSSLEEFMKQTHMPLELRQKSFTVCAELIANALEHGVLGLASSIKDQENGFVKFLELREVGMQKLSVNDSIKLAMQYDSEKSEVSFIVSDSGQGYAYKSVAKQSQSALAGRGISLIDHISSKVHYSKEKNQTSVIIK